MDKKEIENIIKNNLNCEFIEVNGDGRHWFAVIVSEEFKNLNSLKRHRLIYSILKKDLENDLIHAISLKTLTKEDWKNEKENR